MAFILSFFICAVSVAPASAQSLVNTVAGGKIQSGVPAQQVAIGFVRGLTRDGAGNVVFSEGNIIRRIDRDGTIETIAGTGESGFSGDGGPAASAHLYSPSGLQYDAAGNLYFSDTGNSRIRRIDTAGVITTVAGIGIQAIATANSMPPVAYIGAVSSLALDKTGTLYFTESLGPWSRVRRLTREGILQDVAGGPCTSDSCSSGVFTGDGGPAIEAFLGLAGDLTVDGDGNVYVAELNQIRRISPDGIIDAFAGYGRTSDGGPALTADFGAIVSLTADSSGSIYVGELNPVGFGSRIRRISPDGIVHVLAGGGTGGDGPATQALLRNLTGLVTDGEGKLYFSDLASVRQLTPQGTVQTISGGAPKAAPDGANARDAWLSTPSALALGPSGEMYVFEQATCQLRKVGPDGLMSTVAGTGKCGITTPSGSALSTDLPQTGHLVLDSKGRIYGAGNTSGSFLYVIGPDGTVAPVIGNLTLQYPEIAVDSKDRLYLASQLGTSIQRTMPGGTVENLPWILTSVFAGVIAAMAVDRSDNVYVYEPSRFGSGAIVRFNQSGAPTRVGSVTGYSLDSAISVDGTGNVFVTDGFRLIKVTASTALPFGGLFGFSGDGGPAVAGGWENPAGATFAANGDLYFLDQVNNRVRKISGFASKKAPAISQGGIVNAASLVGGPIAPGELISIFGSGFSSPGLLTARAQNNSLPGVLGSTRVFFGNTAGAIAAVTENQINAFVPYGVVGPSFDIIVDVDGIPSTAVTTSVTVAAPGLSSANGSGTGQGAILNQDGSYNSPAHPAARGSVISLYGTGEGLVAPTLPDGALEIAAPFSRPVASPVEVTIGGQNAELLYAGSAPSLPVGVFQVNVRIPASVSPGDVPIIVKVGSSAAARQITVAVQ